jgi:hypothetical protein
MRITSTASPEARNAVRPEGARNWRHRLRRHARVRLAADARYGDLVRAIEERFGHALPDNSLDLASKRFHRHVAVLQDGVELHAPDELLRTGPTIVLGTRIYNRRSPGRWADATDAAQANEGSRPR